MNTDVVQLPLVLKFKKDELNDISAMFSYNLFDWCKKFKIKVDEPQDKKTELFTTMIITIETYEKLLMFSNKWFKKITVQNQKP